MLVMNEFEAHHYVEEFVGPELYEEIQRRIGDGQRIGEAVENAGDRADRTWSWAPKWPELHDSTTWYEVAAYFKAWGSEELVGPLDELDREFNYESNSGFSALRIHGTAAGNIRVGIDTGSSNNQHHLSLAEAAVLEEKLKQFRLAHSQEQ